MTVSKVIIKGEEHLVGGDSHRDIIVKLYPSDYYSYDYDVLSGYDLKVKIGKLKTVDGDGVSGLQKGDIVSFIMMDADPNNSKSGEEKVEEKVEEKIETKGGGAKTSPHGMDNRINIYADDVDPEDPDTIPLQIIYLAPFWWLGTVPQYMQDGYDDADLTLYTNAVIQTGEIREGISPITGEKCLIYMMWMCGRTYVLDGDNPPRE